MTAPRSAVVLGGGVAGISAAFELAERGYRVSLHEAHGWLGGRAFSFDDRRLGRTVDNGPHVILGCYDHLRRLLRRLGTEDGFERAGRLSLAYRDAGGRHSELSLARWPTPLALPVGLLRFGGLTAGERWRALLGALASLAGARAGWSLEDWLVARRQLGGPRRFLWDPLCLAIMNAQPREVSARLFLATMRRAFRGRASRAAIWLPRRPWSALIGEPARAALEHAGVAVHTRSAVCGLTIDGGRVVAVERLGGGNIEIGGLLVSALPWHALAGVLPPPHDRPARGFGARGIVNVYFDAGDRHAPPFEAPLVGLVDGEPFQFLYRTPGAPPGHLVLIASASQTLDGCSTAEIAALARAQLRRHLPELELPADLPVRVTKEARATVLATPALAGARPRPGPWPSLSNLAVCGDWTDTGLPSTLEGAAASARAMVRHLR